MIICPDTFRTRANGTYDASSAASEHAWDETYNAIMGALVAKVSQVTLLVGVPGSGKSTWAYGRQCALDDAHSMVIVDATFSRRAERAPVIQMAAQRQVPVHAVVFMTPLLECWRRNSTRSPDRRVPFQVLVNMEENLRLNPVTLDEGFHSITAVRFAEV